MKTLEVRNFGPIVDSGVLDIRKITVFCGNQGSGKSTLAKLISTFSWLEKSLVRGDIIEKDITSYKHFQKKYCGFHYLTNYFKDDTYLYFCGSMYQFLFDSGRLTVERIENLAAYSMPQIMYVPAERNFMIAVEDADKIRNLPPALSSLQEVYIKSLKALDSRKSLPLEGFAIQYDKLNKIAWLVGDNFKIRMHEAASGFQSVTPLILVSDYLTSNVTNGVKRSLSVAEQERLDRTISHILKDRELAEDVRSNLIYRLSSYQKNDCFFNIVEEPEQNLYPSSQRDVLFRLLSDMNTKQENMLLLTTHSPYILNYLALAIKAYAISCKYDQVKADVDKIVSSDSWVDQKDVALYELSMEGEIRSLAIDDSILTDDNFLNNALKETNDLFNDLLDIEDNAKRD